MEYFTNSWNNYWPNFWRNTVGINKKLLGKFLEISWGCLEVKIQKQSLEEYIKEFLKESLNYVWVQFLKDSQKTYGKTPEIIEKGIHGIILDESPKNFQKEFLKEEYLNENSWSIFGRHLWRISWKNHWKIC